MNIKVVDDAGQPFAGADVSVIYGVGYKNGKEVDETIKGQSDANGVFMASHQDTRSRSLAMIVQKEAYYPVRVVYDLSTSYDAGRWNINETWTLKKIINPIPMYAKSLNTHVPALDAPVGFDLMAGDWVAPFGKGNSRDILFTGHFDKSTNGESDFTLTVSFPNSGDGIQQFEVPPTRFPGDGSALRSSQEVPVSGYQSQWVQTDNRKPGKPVETNRDPNRNYYFRVRTVLDGKGNVKSTLYGKIYGDFMQFRYYLNPTPNDRNIEFDPKHNLMQGLKSFEQVTEP